jgi:hypothetical protein
MNAIALKMRHIALLERSMMEKDIGWKKTLYTIDITLITLSLCARMCHAHQLFIMAICATNWKGSVHFKNVSGGRSCWLCRDDDGCVMVMMKMARNNDNSEWGKLMMMPMTTMTTMTIRRRRG